jgi:hypothetical protein
MPSIPIDQKAAKLHEELAERRVKLARTGFPIHLRYPDLVAAGIVENWTQLLRLINGPEAFPPGQMLGRNTRAWRADVIAEWLAQRPVARKPVPTDARHPRTKRASAEAEATS